jgi:NMT1-like family
MRRSSTLIRRVGGKVIPIPQAAGLRLQHPAFDEGVIPQGSYNGRPAIPERDEPTISVKELLVASEDVPAEVITKITSVLFEHRREMMDLLPLAGAIAAPNRSGETFLPIHAGVWAFWDRDKPSFLQENAEAIALMISLAVVATSAYLQWATGGASASWTPITPSSSSSGYAHGTHLISLDECNALLAAFVGRIGQSAEHGHINPAEFTLFNFTYDYVEDAIKDRLQQLERISGQERKTAASRRPSGVPAGVLRSGGMARRIALWLLVIAVAVAAAIAGGIAAQRHLQETVLADAFARLRLFHELRRAALEDYLKSLASMVDLLGKQQKDQGDEHHREDREHHGDEQLRVVLGACG